MSFAELGVSPSLVAVLDAAGITDPFPVQSLTIADALAGRDVCGKAATGSGKTLAFSVPMVQRLVATKGRTSPRGLVLVPTRELARQVLDVVKPLADASGLRVGVVYGGASMDRQIAAATKGLDVIVATPGRLIDLVQRDVVALDAVEVAVVDEADRMADLGFLPQVQWLLRRFGARHPQVLLFSATLDGQIDALVSEFLRDPVRHEVSADRGDEPDLVHRFLAVHEMDRVKVAAAIGRHAYRTVVFVRTKRGADRLAGQLVREGVKAAAIHGDLRQTQRERALRDFTTGTLPVLVATDVAARGIHVDDIDVVVHFDPPEDHKAYTHRSGRTARAGNSGVVVTFVLWNQLLDVEKLKKRLGLSEPIVEVFSNDPRLADLANFGEVAVA